MAIGGFNGTDPSPTLAAGPDATTGRVWDHSSSAARMMIGHWGSQNSGSQEAADIAEWVEAHYTPLVVERVRGL